MLWPFAGLYGLIVFFRNKLFDVGLIPSTEFGIPLISVGNLRVGGTGKTPHIEFLVRMLCPEYKCAVLSRGYKRKTRGFLLADTYSDAMLIGDEPMQLKAKFPDLMIAVDGNRKRGIQKLLSIQDPPDVILLDDAFQHRFVKPGLSILLSSYNHPETEDMLLPAGRLREPFSSRERADIILITKSPDKLKAIERRIIVKKIGLYPFQNLFFTNILSEPPEPVFPGESRPLTAEKEKPEILLITGIANPREVKRFARNLSPRIHDLYFPDHHYFSEKDTEKINNSFLILEHGNRIALTTEKDATRLRLLNSLDPDLRMNLYYIPIRVGFLNEDEENFKNQILRYVRSNKKNSRIHIGEIQLST